MSPRRPPGPTPPAPARAPDHPPVDTPDGRYLVVRGRLWRKANPALPPAERSELVRALMAARRGVRDAGRAGDATAERDQRAAVHAAKVALGERGPVWWDDGAPDYTRRLARTTPYAGWWARAAADAGGDPGPVG